MARKRRRKIKKSPMDYIVIPNFNLDSDAKKGIVIILILVLGVLGMLGLFGLAGSFGLYLAKGLSFLFGWGRWIFPLLLILLGFFMYNDDKYNVHGINYLGLFLFIISLQTIFHFFIPIDLWKEIIDTGAGGGYLGMQLAFMFNSILGFWGSLIVLISLLLISLILMLEVSLSKIIGSESIFAKILYPFKFLFLKLFSSKKYEDEENEEIEEEYEEENNEKNNEEEMEEVEFDSKEVPLEEGEEPEFMKVATSAIKKESGKKDSSLWKASNIKIDLPLELLSQNGGKPTSGDIKNNALIIQKTFEHFNIPVEMGEISIGPTVTQYAFKPAEGIKLSKITTLSNDLALALAAHPIRIEAPIPGKSLVGIEVPNQSKAIVRLREILSAKDFKTRKSNLMLAIGKDVSGKEWLYDLAKMPHMLVAGATNSGKSVCLNTIIVSLLYQNNPDDLKFIMVDPKRVELPVYNGIPHLLTPVITEIGKTINALKWCLNEMDKRFELLSKHGKKNIQTYNERAKKDEKMPYLVFIIDELADLMVTAGKDIEGSIIRLAQMSRAVGIHLILATQRPSVDVITGLIKANMPTRVAFSVASGVDSKTILDSLGAEKLLGQGDMLFVTAEISKAKRIQGAFVSDSEIKKIVNYIREKGGDANYIEGITDRQKVTGIAGVGMDGNRGDEDELLEEAKEVIINMGKASTTLLQRRLRVGYARAASIMDSLEELGVIGASNGSKPREILISKEQYESLDSQAISGASLHSRKESQAPENYLGAEDVSETPPVFVSSEKNSNEESDEDEEDDEENDEDNSEELDKENEIEEDSDEENENEEKEDDSEEEKMAEEEDSEEENIAEEEDDGKYFSK